ncbi:MAG: FAD-dependent oxidoreductase [Myxococcales bacterium]|jgi:predicted NAD/FAD-binding protein
MRIAIIGSGISGLTAAHHLHRDHELTVFEASDWVGGHAHTVDVEVGGRRVAVDTGFVVFNHRTYPTFIGMLEELGVPFQHSDMSFSVSGSGTDVEYAAAQGALLSLLGRARNAVDPGFWRMLRDIVRFNRKAPEMLPEIPDEMTLGEYLDGAGYSREFIDWHLLPMTAAVWSSGTGEARDFPLRTLVQFFDNHGFLQLRGRPRWLTVTGGSRAYVEALTRPLSDRIRLSTPVRSVSRDADGVTVATDAGAERFDRVIVAVHSDQALSLLTDPSPQEREILGGIPYTKNEVVLHTDPVLMPKHRRAWASWNYHLDGGPAGVPTVTYWMNRLHGFVTPEALFVTLNRGDAIDPSRVLRRFEYAHPLFSVDALHAQRRREEIDGQRGTHYCGAYWGYGFHEDGARSGLSVAAAINGSARAWAS